MTTGKKTVKPIGLSRAGTKYIGETEKNLSGALKRAARAGALPAGDEAAPLFGKKDSRPKKKP